MEVDDAVCGGGYFYRTEHGHGLGFGAGYMVVFESIYIIQSMITEMVDLSSLCAFQVRDLDTSTFKKDDLLIQAFPVHKWHSC